MLPPGPVLRPFVRCYAQRTVSASELSSDAHVEAIPARLEQTLEFQLGKSFDVAIPGKAPISAPQVTIVGAYLGRCAHIHLVPGVLSFAVFFLPTGLSRLLGIPVSEFTGRNFDATLILTSLRELRTRLGEAASFADRVHLVEDLLLHLVACNARKNSLLDVAEFAFARRGTISIDKLAQTTGLGFRQFERRFCEGLGATPKLFARVARFQSAVDAKISAPHRSWLEIAHELEYHDQMHMIHDFKDFTGHSPTQLLPQIGDGRPSALMSDEIAENSKLWC
jgi:AraC-like DNA-binding protein